MKCAVCKQKISAEYVQHVRKKFHPEHFLCSICGKVIQGNYSVNKGKPTHADCLARTKGMICTHCNKELQGKFIEKEGKKYHPECFETHIAERCAICGLPIVGKGIIDEFGNVYHYKHKNLPKCHNCGRAISDSLTGGGARLGDGRNLCNLCITPTRNTEEVHRLFLKAFAILRRVGLPLRKDNIAVHAVNFKQLKRVHGWGSSKYLRGFCKTETATTSRGNQIVDRRVIHNIFLLDRVPESRFLGVLAHELMHAWVNENCRIRHRANLLEGSCNFVAFRLLDALGTPDAKQEIRMMEKDSDKIYGLGFRKVRQKFGNMPIEKLLEYLRKRTSI